MTPFDLRRAGSILLTVVAIAGCTAGPGGSASASAATSGTASMAPSPETTPAGTVKPPSAVPSEAPPTEAPRTEPGFTARPTLGPLAMYLLEPGRPIRIDVAELSLRDGPSTDAKRLKILRRGDVVVVSPEAAYWYDIGPVQGEGYTWYPVAEPDEPALDGKFPPLPYRPTFTSETRFGGWIATDDGETSFVAPVRPRCTTTIDIVHVQALLSGERLGCIDTPIVLEGTFGCHICGANFPADIEPDWLAYPEALSFLTVHAPNEYGPIVLRFNPDGVAAPPNGSIIRVTVHLDDPAAQSCAGTVAGVPVPVVTAVEWCRQQFVVDSYAVLGMDPAFTEG